MSGKISSALPFPVKLHDMLHDAEKKGFQHIVSWLPEGNRFQIHDPEALTDVLQVYFRQTKYKSFLRQLQNYGFARILKGPGKGICRHELFLKGNRVISQRIKRVSRSNPSPTLSSEEKTVIVTRILSAPTTEILSVNPDRQLSMIETKKSTFLHLSAAPRLASTPLFQIDPLVSNIPPCEILLSDIRMPLLCQSKCSSMQQRELEEGIFEGQRFFFL
jgi:hypothetical protein